MAVVVAGNFGLRLVVNKDDHFDFAKPANNFIAVTREHVSWGYFDFRKRGEPAEQGYESVPVDWGVTSERKKGFFGLVY